MFFGFVITAGMLVASLIWGSVGMGYLIYGQRQRSWICMLGGGLIMAITYFTTSALLMSVVSIALIAGIHWMLSRED